MSAIAALRHEYDAAPGTFLHLATARGTWDYAAFDRLQRAMAEVCEELRGQEPEEPWITDMFWRVEGFVREHRTFQRPSPPDYFEDAKRKTADLCSWFFTGRRPVGRPDGQQLLTISRPRCLTYPP